MFKAQNFVSRVVSFQIKRETLGTRVVLHGASHPKVDQVFGKGINKGNALSNVSALISNAFVASWSLKYVEV